MPKAATTMEGGRNHAAILTRSLLGYNKYFDVFILNEMEPGRNPYECKISK
jgi:hypothetical protein